MKWALWYALYTKGFYYILILCPIKQPCGTILKLCNQSEPDTDYNLSYMEGKKCMAGTKYATTRIKHTNHKGINSTDEAQLLNCIKLFKTQATKPLQDL